MWRTVALAATVGLLLIGSAQCLRAQVPVHQLTWHTDYAKAVAQAKETRRMLLVFFYAPGRNNTRDCFLCQALPRALRENRERVERYVWLQLPTNATIEVGDKPVQLLGHPSFQHMQNQQGIAIIDYAHENESYYGYVVSQFPFRRGTYYNSASLGVILDLPPGTLTQRTMTYAVRTHPESPRSTDGQLHPVLAKEAERHSTHQANLGVQGHHSWDTRFHQINARLGVTAQEVVAESWPGESLLDAAEECVQCWRKSSGHWSAVVRPHRVWAFDMKRGRNGVWYGTGLFGR